MSPATRSSTASRAVRNRTGTSGSRGTHPAQHLEPVEVRQHHVEHDGVGVEGLRGGHGPGPGVSRGHLETLVAQGHADQLGDVLLVVDDEDAQRRSVRPGEVHASSLVVPAVRFL